MEEKMNQTELLGFIIEHQEVTSGEIAQRFNIPVTFAHQVLRRLEDKRLLTRKGGPYRYTFELSAGAKEKLDNLRNDHKGYGWVFLLGLAVGLLVGFSPSRKDDKNNAGKNEKRDSII